MNMCDSDCIALVSLALGCRICWMFNFLFRPLVWCEICLYFIDYRHRVSPSRTYEYMSHKNENAVNGLRKRPGPNDGRMQIDSQLVSSRILSSKVVAFNTRINKYHTYKQRYVYNVAYFSIVTYTSSISFVLFRGCRRFRILNKQWIRTAGNDYLPSIGPCCVVSWADRHVMWTNTQATDA